MLQHSLRRVSLMSAEKTRGVSFALDNGKLEISCNNPELGEAHEVMDVDYSDDSLTLGFNAKYLLDVLSVIDTEQVSIAVNDPVSPGKITAVGNDDYLSIIMPMRI
jgi:DNA polymerase-3 subunit beta